MRSDQSYLMMRVSIARDLYKAGRISRGEMFRAEVDQCVGRNSGPLKVSEVRRES